MLWSNSAIFLVAQLCCSAFSLLKGVLKFSYPWVTCFSTRYPEVLGQNWEAAACSGTHRELVSGASIWAKQWICLCAFPFPASPGATGELQTQKTGEVQKASRKKWLLLPKMSSLAGFSMWLCNALCWQWGGRQREVKAKQPGRAGGGSFHASQATLLIYVRLLQCQPAEMDGWQLTFPLEMITKLNSNQRKSRVHWPCLPFTHTLLDM